MVIPTIHGGTPFGRPLRVRSGGPPANGFFLNVLLLQFVFFVFLVYHHEQPVIFVEHEGQVIVRVYDVGQEIFVADGFEFIHEFEGWMQLL